LHLLLKANGGTAAGSRALFVGWRHRAADGGQTMPYVENDRIVEHTDEARAAVTGHNVRYVLLISTLAVIVLFAVAYIATTW
jgi:hypothetical protein